FHFRLRPPPRATLFPYPTLFRSRGEPPDRPLAVELPHRDQHPGPGPAVPVHRGRRGVADAHRRCDVRAQGGELGHPLRAHRAIPAPAASTSARPATPACPYPSSTPRPTSARSASGTSVRTPARELVATRCSSAA